MSAIVTDAAASRRAAKRPWPRRIGNGAVVLGLLVALAIGFTHLLGFYLVQRELRQMRAAGEPLTLQELFDARPDVPDEQNSALLVLSLRDEMLRACRTLTHGVPPNSGGLYQRFKPYGPWRREDVELLCDFVADHGRLLEKIQTIQFFPMGRYPLQNQPYVLDIPYEHIDPVFAAVDLLAVSACTDLFDGQPGAALDRCKAMLNVTRPLYDEPLRVSGDVASTCDRLTVSMIEETLTTAEVNGSLLQQLQSMLLEHEERCDFTAALRGERLMMRAFFQQLDHMLPAYSRERLAEINVRYLPPPQLLRWTGLSRVNETRCLAYFSRLIETADQPQLALRTSNEVMSHWLASGPLYGISRVLWYDRRRFIELAVVDRVRLACARTALAAERYRLDRGDWPASLDALVPDYLDAVPIDHFDGQPLRLKQTDEGLLVYSVGEDGADDGGDHITRKDRRPADLGFFVRDPALRGLRIVEALEVEEADQTTSQ